MGFLDKFKNKKATTNFPENELEMCLMKAASNYSGRKDFYSKLLLSDLIVISADNNSVTNTKITLAAGTLIGLVHLQNGNLPVFTSKNRIFDKGLIKEQVSYMSMKGQDLFSFTKGSTLILNPFSDYGKELLPEEIERLLDGSIFNETHELIIEQPSPVQLGQPINYPHKIVMALTELFINRTKVKAAYLASIKMTESEENFHLIIGIDYEGQLTEISNETGPIVESHIKKGEIVDFIQIDNESDVSEYFINKTKPFYLRK